MKKKTTKGVLTKRYHNWYPEVNGQALMRKAELKDYPNSAKKSFVLSWHEDHNNYWHYTFDAHLFRIFLLLKECLGINIKELTVIVIGNKQEKWQKDLYQRLLGMNHR